MTMKIRPPATSDITAFLRRLFLRTEKELIQEIKKKRNREQVEYAEVAALERVQGILQNMIDTSWSYVPVMIEKIFYHSDKDAAGYSNARSLASPRSVTQLAIMEQLSNNLQGQIVEMAGTAKKSVETVFTIARLEDDPYRKLTLEQVLREEAAGKPWIKSSQDLVKDMELMALLVLRIRRAVNGAFSLMETWQSGQLRIRQKSQHFYLQMTMIYGRS